MPSPERCSQSPAPVPSCWLDKKAIDPRLTKNFSVGDAVECDTARHAKVLETGAALDATSHQNEDLFNYCLNTGRDVCVVLVSARLFGEVGRTLSEVGRKSGCFGEEGHLRWPRGAKQFNEFLAVSVGRRMVEREVAHIEPEAAVLAYTDQRSHLVRVAGRAERRHSHYLVLAIVYLEPQKGGKGAVQ